jgi:hypothetical protein
MYVEGNPVNYVDPSGRRPERDEIIAGRHVYSCSCGWIDLDHADPDKSKVYFDLLNARPNRPQNIKARDDVLLVTLHIYPGPFKLSNNAVIKTGLSDDVKKEVALGMFMAQEENYENFQDFFGHNSAYSEEDLASDLIGFHMWVNGFAESARDDFESWRWLSRTCGFPLDKNKAKQWSLDVFDSYPEFGQVYEWATPRLVCTKDTQQYCGIRRSFPQIFQTISPQKPSANGNWWWYRGIYVDGAFLTTNIKDVYFLQDITEKR